MTANQIAYWNLLETQRTNRAKEQEQRRTNLANEEIKRQTNANTLELGQSNVSETHRYNVANINEQERTHRRNEDIAAYNAATQREKLNIDQYNADIAAKNAATNAMNAITNAGALIETQRANLASESIRQDQNTETNRSNIANEDINRFKAATSYGVSMTDADTKQRGQQESERHDIATERETRHNNNVNQLLNIANTLINLGNAAAKNQLQLQSQTIGSLSKFKSY